MAQLTINIQNLCKSFKQMSGNIAVLKDLNFQAFDGESSAVIGQSGSGKSTFLSLIAGLDDPDSGMIHVMNKDMASMNTAERAVHRRDHISMIFQEFHLMDHLDAKENVALALDIAGSQNRDELSEKALADVGLSDRLHHLPSKLSGGEKQRVAIARAFVTQPKILIADEPSGNLDPDTGEEVMEILWKLVKTHKMSLILVTHNPLLAKQCHKVYKLEAGQLTSLS